MERTLRMAERRGAMLLFLDEDMTFGADHLTSALHHAKKAFAEGRNSSDSLAMETLLYASGERQLSSAIRKMGVDDETTGVVIARLTEVDVDPETGWTPYRDDLRQPDEERLLRFGISREELATAHETRRLDLVLEKVAAVDLIRK
ncbi:MAG: hypothetical protein JSV90_08020 [Methanobacteriota archaeon]|nr:MAG: hypothetical protein JSV90_08020 [Euryarchaeota archaeon]